MILCAPGTKLKPKLTPKFFVLNCLPGVDLGAHADESDDAVHPLVSGHHVQRRVPVEVLRFQLATGLGQRLDDLLLLGPVQGRAAVLYVLQ